MNLFFHVRIKYSHLHKKFNKVYIACSPSREDRTQSDMMRMHFKELISDET